MTTEEWVHDMLTHMNQQADEATVASVTAKIDAYIRAVWRSHVNDNPACGSQTAESDRQGADGG